MRKISKNATDIDLICMAQYDMGRMEVIKNIQECLKTETEKLEKDAKVLTEELHRRDKKCKNCLEK